MDIKQPWLPLVTKMLGDVFDWDGKTLTTLKNLLIHPGKLTLEFVRGYRKKYTAPVRLYLVVSLLFFYIFPMIIPIASGEASSVNTEPATEQYSRMMFVLLPVFALLLKLFYLDKYYLQHLVFSMHLFSAMFIVFALMLSMENLADASLYWVIAQSTVFGYMIWYCLTALKVSYETTWSISALKLFGLVALFLPTLSGALQLADLI